MPIVSADGDFISGSLHGPVPDFGEIQAAMVHAARCMAAMRVAGMIPLIPTTDGCGCLICGKRWLEEDE